MVQVLDTPEKHLTRSFYQALIGDYVSLQSGLQSVLAINRELERAEDEISNSEDLAVRVTEILLTMDHTLITVISNTQKMIGGGSYTVPQIPSYIVKKFGDLYKDPSASVLSRSFSVDDQLADVYGMDSNGYFREFSQAFNRSVGDKVGVKLSVELRGGEVHFTLNHMKYLPARASLSEKNASMQAVLEKVAELYLNIHRAPKP